MSDKKARLLNPVETSVIAGAIVKNASLLDGLQQYLQTPEGQRAIAGAGIGAGAGGLAGILGGGGGGTALASALMGGGIGAAGGHYAPAIQALFSKLLGGGGEGPARVRPPEGTLQASGEDMFKGSTRLNPVQALLGPVAMAGGGSNPAGRQVSGPGVTRMNHPLGTITDFNPFGR